MIIPLEKKPQEVTSIIRRPNWKHHLKTEIYKANMERIKNQPRNRNRALQRERKEAVNHYVEFIEHGKRFKVKDKEQPNSPQYSYYSNFVPLDKQTKLFEDQFITTFPYMAHLDEKANNTSKYNYYHEISCFMIKCKEENRIHEGWKECLKVFVCSLDTLKAIELYLQFLKSGTSVLHHLQTTYAPQCRQEIFFHRICQTSRYFKKALKANRLTKISVDCNDEVNEITMSKTMKNLYCSICLVYDCSIHQFEDQAIEKNFQYVSPTNKISTQVHIQQALEICIFLKRLEDGDFEMVPQKEQKSLCSANCYKQLNKHKFQQVKMKRLKLLSPIIKGLIKIGIEIYSYDPCMIWNLFPDEKKGQSRILCELVFLFFVEEYNIVKTIERKFHQSEYDLLMSEKTLDLEDNVYGTTLKKHRKYGQKGKAKIKNDSQKQGACFHHFLNQTSFDLNCSECHCRKRGYCISQCLCSSSCPIRRKGCACKHFKDECRTNKCQCYLDKEQCQPGLCLGCFDTESHVKKNNCENQKLLRRQSKLIRIGKSTIPGAGLGGFAGEAIEKNELVGIYSGQMIDHDVDSIRETLSHDLSFYNFGSPLGTIDARFLGNKSRFINHQDSGRENLRADNIISDGTTQIVFYAQRNIEKDQQLFFDYDGEGDLFKNHKHKYPFIKKKK